MSHNSFCVWGASLFVNLIGSEFFLLQPHWSVNSVSFLKSFWVSCFLLLKVYRSEVGLSDVGKYWTLRLTLCIDIVYWRKFHDFYAFMTVWFLDVSSVCNNLLLLFVCCQFFNWSYGFKFKSLFRFKSRNHQVCTKQQISILVLFVR